MTTLSDPISISVPAAARVLGISQAHAYSLAADDKLPGAYRLGGRVLVHVPTLLREIEAKASKSAPTVPVSQSSNQADPTAPQPAATSPVVNGDHGTAPDGGGES